MTPPPKDLPALPDRFGDRHPTLALALVYTAVFAVYGIYTPYFPVWLKARGFSEQQISLAMSAPMVLRLAVTPLIGRIADSRSDRRWLMAGLIAACLGMALVLPHLSGVWAILPVTCLMLVLYQPVQPLLDATVGVLARRGRVGDIGRLRLCGSVSFAVIALGAGFLLEASGIDALFAGYAALLGIACFVALLLPGVGALERQAQDRPFNLLERPALLVAFAVVALVSSSQAMYMSFGTMHMLAIGYPDWSIGLIWTVSVAAEVVVLWYAPAALARLGAYRLLMAAALMTVVRWCGMAFDPPLVAIILLQTLHAGTLSCTYLGLMATIRRFVEDEAGARAQSAATTMTGLFMAAMTVITGPLYARFGGLAYGFAAILPALAVLMLLAFRRRLA